MQWKNLRKFLHMTMSKIFGAKIWDVPNIFVFVLFSYMSFKLSPEINIILTKRMNNTITSLLTPLNAQESNLWSSSAVLLAWAWQCRKLEINHSTLELDKLEFKVSKQVLGYPPPIIICETTNSCHHMFIHKSKSHMLYHGWKYY